MALLKPRTSGLCWVTQLSCNRVLVPFDLCLRLTHVCDAGGMAASRRCGDGSTPSLKQRSSWPLPEGVLLCILGFLDTNTLLSTAALVCKGWRELTLSAQLLSTVEAQLPGAEEALLSRLRLFRAWLQRRAGQHVRRLRIVMPDYGVPHGAQGPDEEAAQLLLRIDSKLVAVCQDLGRHHQASGSCALGGNRLAASALAARSSRALGIASLGQHAPLPRLARVLIAFLLFVHDCLVAGGCTPIPCTQLEDLSVSLRFDGMFSSLPEGWATALGPTLRRLRLDVEQGFVVVEEGALQVDLPALRRAPLPPVQRLLGRRQGGRLAERRPVAHAGSACRAAPRRLAA